MCGVVVNDECGDRVHGLNLVLLPHTLLPLYYYYFLLLFPLFYNFHIFHCVHYFHYFRYFAQLYQFEQHSQFCTTVMEENTWKPNYLIKKGNMARKNGKPRAVARYGYENHDHKVVYLLWLGGVLYTHTHTYIYIYIYNTKNDAEANP